MIKEDKIIRTYATALIALDYQNDEYEMLETPFTKKLHMKTEGSIRELEESGVILSDPLRAFRVAENSILELYAGGIEEPLALHALLYILSADMTRYIPISVNIVFDWDEDAHGIGTAYGSLRQAKDVPVIHVPCEASVSA